MNSESPLPVKTRIFNIIQIGDKSNRISRAFDIFITVVIFSNILVTFLQTFSELSFLSGFFHVTEVVTLCIFCIEYALRIWTADLLYPSKSRLRSRLRFLGKSGHSRRAHIRNNISGLNFPGWHSKSSQSRHNKRLSSRSPDTSLSYLHQYVLLSWHRQSTGYTVPFQQRNAIISILVSDRPSFIKIPIVISTSPAS